MTGAQFEILVDGKPQSYSDFKEVAIASAELIKSHNPLSEVAVRDMKTGEMTPVSYNGAHDAPDRLGSGVVRAHGLDAFICQCVHKKSKQFRDCRYASLAVERPARLLIWAADEHVLSVVAGGLRLASRAGDDRERRARSDLGAC
ncbi:MAG: hypothetical protein WCC77_16680 [Pseudolabrys sp.]